jgi:hypothetical protein
MTTKRRSQRPGDANVGAAPAPEVGPSGHPPSPAVDGTSAPARRKDTGGELFFNGQLYYRQVDDLCINICVAKKLDNEEWLDFLKESLRLTNQIGRQGVVTIAAFAHTHPSAVQRRLTSEFLSANDVPPMKRMGSVSDNPLVRGAVTALSWTLLKATMRSFSSREFDVCLEWLKQVAMFDLAIAVGAWKEGLARLRK